MSWSYIGTFSIHTICLMIPIKVDTLPIIKCNRLWSLFHIWSKNYKFTSSTFWEINTFGGYNNSSGFTRISKLIILRDKLFDAQEYSFLIYLWRKVHLGLLIKSCFLYSEVLTWKQYLELLAEHKTSHHCTFQC